MMVIEDLQKTYASNTILKKINFHVQQNDFLGIIGANGSGKSTLLKCLAGLISFEGNIQLYNKCLYNYTSKQRAQMISFFSQDPLPDKDIMVRKVVKMGRYPHLKRFQDLSLLDHNIIDIAILKTFLCALQHKNASELSGGERQRLAWAQMWTQQTSLLLLDEPTANLDMGATIKMLKLLKKLHDEMKIAIVMVMHDCNLAAQICQRIMIIHKGEILGIGKPRDILTTNNLKKIYDIEIGEIENPINKASVFFAKGIN